LQEPSSSRAPKVMREKKVGFKALKSAKLLGEKTNPRASQGHKGKARHSKTPSKIRNLHPKISRKWRADNLPTKGKRVSRKPVKVLILSKVLSPGRFDRDSPTKRKRDEALLKKKGPPSEGPTLREDWPEEEVYNAQSKKLLHPQDV